MKKSEMKQIIRNAIANVKQVNATFRYEPNYYNLVPLKMNEKLFLVIHETDFIFDGYCIFRFKDLKKINTRGDKYDEILALEGLKDNIRIPDIDIDNWKTVLDCLKRFNRNIIIERQMDDEGFQFIIGKIESTYKNFAYIQNFDAEGVWDDRPMKVQYSEITDIKFGNRYVDIFSKYIGEPPNR